MKPVSSLLAKILSWFFLNLILVAIALVVFFAFQPYVNLRAIFGQQERDRLKTASILIGHDLRQTSRDKWSDVLTRHAEIHGVDFMIVHADGSRFSSTDEDLPEQVNAKVREALKRKPPWDRFAPPRINDDSQRLSRDANTGYSPKNGTIVKKPPGLSGRPDRKLHFRMRTQNPTRYWVGILIRQPPDPPRHPLPAMFLAVSDSKTGHGFFFDPLPWMVVAAAIILISVLLWIPMVRNITRSLARMTRATEEIANGRFDVSIREPRTDEIGRLAKAINHMTTRLSALVKGQKRFLGDVAHELGSPIARIQFGLGALEQRIETENRQRVIDVMEDVDHMSKLVNELLAFSRADMKSNTIELEKINLLPVVQTAVKREIRPPVEVVVRIDPGIRVAASSELLTRALTNLLRNAIKYAGEAGPIDVSAQKKNGEVEIELRDRGPGVPEELIDQLFEPFFRPEPSRDRNSGGVGLGLAIVKTCVDACKGTVSAANLKPNGFSVTITLNT